MKDKVLILSHREGFEADPVIDKLRERGIDLFRFNTDDGANASKISFSFRDKTRLILECDGRTLDADEIKTAWFQQGYPFPIESTDPVASLQRANLTAAYDQIENFTDYRWLNRPSDATRASNKILQLKAAERFGMRVPETLVSSDAKMIREFCAEPSVMKNLNTPWFFENGDFKAAYTKPVTDAILNQELALEFSPIIYQRAIQKRDECRVAAVDGKTFAVSSPPSENSIDIREEARTGDNFRPTQFPETEKAKLMGFMDHLGLNYCGADYLIDESGDWIFLEANTSGAWWWVDKHYEGQIKTAIADYLAK